MKSKVRAYIENLTQEVTASIQKDYDLSGYAFKSFDYINFSLINDFILSESDKDLFIGIPEDEYRQNFFESILYSVSLIKYYQNFCNQQQEDYRLKKGDIFFAKDEIYEYGFREQDKIYAARKFATGSRKGAFSPIAFEKYPILLSQEDFKYQPRTTSTFLSGYQQFYKSKLRDRDIKLLTSFPNKSLIISSKEISNINDYIPYRYWSKGGNKKHTLPIEVMIEICNDFKTAKKHLLDKEQKFDELIIVGDTKYNKDEDFREILNARNLGQFKNLILIGSTKPTTAHKFLSWDWSNEEVKIANNEPVTTFRKHEIDFPELTSLTEELLAKIEEYKQAERINLSACLKFCNFYFKLPLPTDEKCSALIDDYLNRITLHFESDVIDKLFHDADIYEPDRIDSIKKNILFFFERLGILLKSKNPKLAFLIAKAKENFRVAAIIDKHFALNVESFMKQQGISNATVISEKRNNESQYDLESWVKQDSIHYNSLTYYIPYAINLEQFKTLLNLKGQIIFLCYSNLDSLRFTRINEQLVSESETKLSHKDRETFTNVRYVTTDPTKEHSFDSLFFSDGKNVKEISDEEKLLEEYRDEIEYKIIFTDNTTLVAKSSKAVFLIDGNEQMKITIGDSFAGATIRFYRNETPEDFERTLKHFDKDGLLNKISHYSKVWKDALHNLKQHFGGEVRLLKKHTDKKLRIAPITFTNYFKPDNETHFPRLQTLKIIKEICVESDFSHLPFVIEYNELLKYRAKDKEIRQSVGRGLSTDLLDWVAKGVKSENLQSIPDDILNNIKSSVQVKTIKSKKIIDRHEVRLQTELPFNF